MHARDDKRSLDPLVVENSHSVQASDVLSPHDGETAEMHSVHIDANPRMGVVNLRRTCPTTSTPTLRRMNAHEVCVHKNRGIHVW